jgi:hypothetical protein
LTGIRIASNQGIEQRMLMGQQRAVKAAILLADPQ